MKKIFIGLICCFSIAAGAETSSNNEEKAMEIFSSMANMMMTMMEREMANDAKEFSNRNQTILIQSPVNKNKKVVCWCSSKKQFFPYVQSCDEGWKVINIPE